LNVRERRASRGPKAVRGDEAEAFTFLGKTFSVKLSLDLVPAQRHGAPLMVGAF
jgi:hypothetical protein